jgi:hypothetical protein
MTPLFKDQIFYSGFESLEISLGALLNHVVIEQQLDTETCVSIVDAIPLHQMHNRYIVTDNYLQRDHHALWPQLYSMYLAELEYQLRAPDRLYNCFINRIDPFRQSWLYQLQRRGWIDQGYVTYNLYMNDRNLKNFPWKTQQELYQGMFEQGNQIFAQEHEALRARVPINNLSSTLEQAIIDSRVTIVLETYVDRPDSISLSEKIFRSLQLPRPWLLFASMGAVEHVRRCGFDTLDDVVDHGYDTEPTPARRQELILDQVANWQSRQYNTQLVERLLAAQAHNKNRLRQLVLELPEKIVTTVEQLKKLKALTA